MLTSCLRALTADPSADGAEIVVVDNGSSDETHEVVEQAARPRYVFEPQPGVSNARNSGAEDSRAEILLFVDDDVRVRPGWTAAMSAPLAAGDADATVCRFLFPPGRDRHGASDASLAALMTDSSIDPAHPFLVGGSMGIRRAVLAEAGGFCSELGPGALGAGGEDLLLTFQLQRAGRRITFVHETSVEHWFDEAKLDRAALISRAAAGARSDAWLSYHWFGRTVVAPGTKAVVFKLALAGCRLAASRKDAAEALEAKLAARAAWQEQFSYERGRRRHFSWH
jgi:glycosyltransferase involved in cell wall biosynthesis